MPAVAVTDHGNMFGAFHFFHEALQNGVRPIIGVEAYIAPGNRRDREEKAASESGEGYAYHLTILAATQKGYRNLVRLVSEAYLSGFYHRPRMDKELLREHAEGLIGLSGCLKGEVAGSLSRGNFAAAKKAFLEYEEIFGKGNFYVEIMDHGLPQQTAIVPDLLRLATETGAPAVATNDSHYLRRDDAFPHEVLLCIGMGKTLEDERRMRFYNDEFYVKDPDEMKARFRSWSAEAVTNTVAIAERCAVSFDTDGLHLPTFTAPDGRPPVDYFRDLARAGLDRRLAEDVAQMPETERSAPEKYRERLEYEMGVIEKMGFPSYFLIVSDFIRHAREKGIAVGPGRGSAAGSIVSWALRITDIDPLRYDLLFERFLNPERISMPDIDIDFCQARRGEVIEYVTKRYGRENVAQIVTFSQLKPKLAVRDVARVLSLPVALGDRIAKLVPDGPDVNFERAFRDSPGLKEAMAADESIAKVVRIAERLEGLSRHAGMHAAGVVIAPRPITDFLPLYRTNKDEITTQFDMNAVEKMGLLKIDFLGLITLDVLEATVGRRTGAPRSDDRPRPPASRRRADLRALPFRKDRLRLPVRLERHARSPPPGEAARLPRPCRPERPLPPGRARRGHRRGLRAAAGRHPRDVPASRARADPHRDPRHPGVPGAGHADRPGRRRLFARRGGPPAQGHRQEEARDHAGRSGEVHPQVGGARHAEEEGAGAVVADRAVRPLRIQQVPRGRVRPRGLQDGIPEGALSDRLLRGQPLGRDRIDRRHRQGPRRLPGVRDRGPASRHQRVRRELLGCRPGHPLRPRRHQGRRGGGGPGHPRGAGKEPVRLVLRFHRAPGFAAREQAHPRRAHRGGGLRLARPEPGHARRRLGARSGPCGAPPGGGRARPVEPLRGRAGGPGRGNHGRRLPGRRGVAARSETEGREGHAGLLRHGASPDAVHGRDRSLRRGTDRGARRRASTSPCAWPESWAI